MDTITKDLNGSQPPGIYRLNLTMDPGALKTLCQAQGWQLFHLNGRAIASKADFLQQAATAMHFPDYFGQNWDAFEDCLTDLDWLPAPRYILLFTQPENFAQNAAAEWQTLWEIFQSAIAFWSQTDTPMYLLLQTSSSQFRTIPSL